MTISYLLFFPLKLSYPIRWLIAAEWDILLRSLWPKCKIFRPLFSNFCGNWAPYFHSSQLQCPVWFLVAPSCFSPTTGPSGLSPNNNLIVTPLLAAERNHRTEVSRSPLLILILLQLAYRSPELQGWEVKSMVSIFSPRLFAFSKAHMPWLFDLVPNDVAQF